jgi:hypothetical protein
LNKNSVHVTEYYILKNWGSDQTVTVGFPEALSNMYKEAKVSPENETITGFSSSIDGASVPITTLPDDKVLGSGKIVIKRWFVKEISFRPGEVKSVQVDYDTVYEVHPTAFYDVVYFYGTASSWKDGIKHFTVRVYNPAELWIFGLIGGVNYYSDTNAAAAGTLAFNIRQESGDFIEVEQSNVKPAITDALLLTAGAAPAFIQDLGDAQAPPVSKESLALMTQGQLRIMRNWFYAVHGMIFKSRDLADYFASFHYNPQFDNVDRFLTQDDKNSIELIKTFETAK